MAVAPAFGNDGDSQWRSIAASGTATIATLGLLFLLVTSREAQAEHTAQTMVFAPGELIAMGTNATDPPGGHAAVTPPDPTPVEDPPVDDAPDTITDDATVQPQTPPPPQPTSRARPRPRVDDPNPLTKLPPPLIGHGHGAGGSPSGVPAGFSTRLRRGDAWATDVLAALARAPVGTFAGSLPVGTLRFSVSVCANGSLRRVKVRSGTSMDAEGVKQVKLAIENVRVPKPPAAMRAGMGGECTRLDYTFAWTAAGVE